MLWLWACAATPEPSDAPVEPVTWQADIKPLFAQRCTPCHTGNAFGGTNFELYREVVADSSIGLPYITPGSPEDSYLWHKVHDTQEEVGGDGERMPFEVAPLPADELELLELWILEGARQQ